MSRQMSLGRMMAGIIKTALKEIRFDDAFYDILEAEMTAVAKQSSVFIDADNGDLSIVFGGSFSEKTFFSLPIDECLCDYSDFDSLSPAQRQHVCDQIEALEVMVTKIRKMQKDLRGCLPDENGTKTESVAGSVAGTKGVRGGTL